MSKTSKSKTLGRLISIENNTTLSLLAKWVVENWVSVLLVTVLSITCFKFYRDAQVFKDLALQEEIKALQTLVESNAAINAELRSRVQELSSLKNQNKQANLRVREDSKKLTPPELRNKISEYVDRGKSARGVK